MYLAEKFVFLELQKTGCSHIGQLLKQLVDGQQIGKHNRFHATQHYNAIGKRQIIGSVRNPWDWYVSLWSFGCGGNGALYGHLLDVAKNNDYERSVRPIENTINRVNNLISPATDWKTMYANRKDPELFRRWLRAIHNPRYRSHLGEGYGDSPVSLFAGFMTYRFAYLFSKDFIPLYSGAIATPTELESFVSKHCNPASILRSESLEDDLVVALRKCGVELTEEQLSLVYSGQKTNQSARQGNLDFYYDKATIKLVEEREKIIIERYNYRYG